VAIVEAIIDLPKEPYFDLADIFELRTMPINTHRGLIILKMVAIPPAIVAQSAEAWEIDEYLQEVYQTLFLTIKPIDRERNLQATWIFEEFTTHLLQILPQAQVAAYVEQLITRLTRFFHLCPDLFALVWERKACWQEKRERGLTQTESWVQELKKAK
jgi:hypothetical protein